METKKLIASAFIGWHLFNLIVDGLPSTCLLQDAMQFDLQRYMNVVGQWQGSLAFFAPNPDSVNLHVEAEVEFTDGSKQHWRSPDWKNMTPWQRLRTCRQIKYFDNIRRDDRSNAWESFANWLAREHETDGRKVKRVEISRHWVDLPPPASLVYNPLVDLPHDKVYTFYRKDFT